MTTTYITPAQQSCWDELSAEQQEKITIFVAAVLTPAQLAIIRDIPYKQLCEIPISVLVNMSPADIANIGLKQFADALGGNALNIAKREAISQFIRRAKFAESHEKYDNSELPAGSPVYGYCQFCGILIERLPEDYLFPPLHECSQCSGLKKQGWLEDAQRSFLLEKVENVAK